MTAIDVLNWFRRKRLLYGFIKNVKKSGFVFERFDNFTLIEAFDWEKSEEGFNCWENVNIEYLEFISGTVVDNPPLFPWEKLEID